MSVPNNQGMTMINREFEEIVSLISDGEKYAFRIDFDGVLILGYSNKKSRLEWNMIYEGVESSQRLEFEDYLLGGLFDNNQIIQLIDLIDWQLLKRPEHKLIHQAVLGLYEMSRPISPEYVIKHLEQNGAAISDDLTKVLLKTEDIDPWPEDLDFIGRLFNHFEDCKRNNKLQGADYFFHLEKTTVFKQVDAIILTKFVKADMSIKQSLQKLVPPKRTFMEIMKVHKSETAVANLLAHFFRPNESHGLHDLFIRSLLSTKCYPLATGENAEDKGVQNGVDHSEPFGKVEVKVEEVVNKGNERIDILIVTNTIVVCIEFKINHELNNPLNIYESYVKSEYPNRQYLFLVLTPKRKMPKGQAIGNKVFKQMVLSHFVDSIKNNLKNVNVSSIQLDEFLQTMDNRSANFKVLKLLEANGHDIETVPLRQVPANWLNFLVEMKLRKYADIVNGVYRSNNAGGFVEVVANSKAIKVRWLDGFWQSEIWHKDDEGLAIKLDNSTKRMEGPDFPTSI